MIKEKLENQEKKKAKKEMERKLKVLDHSIESLKERVFGNF
jgi:hypothetical protein